MRILVILLLLANALYFGWATWVDVPATGRAAAPLRGLEVKPALAAGEESGAATGAAVGEPRRCASLGPLADAEQSRNVQVALVAQRLSGRERTVVADEPEGWWVHIDKLADSNARARAVHKLQVAGIRGAVALGDTAQVSVGLFASQASAEARAAAVQKAGLAGEVSARNHLVTRYWLDVEAAASVPLPAVDALVAPGKRAQPTWQPCPSAGSPASGAGEGAASQGAATASPASGPAGESTAPTTPATAPQR